jgi:high-affinity iron transporter
MAAQGPEAILHMLDYIRVDYPATVKGRHVINIDEYGEMQEFSAQVVALTRTLEESGVKPVLLQEAVQLQQAIEQRLAPKQLNPLVQSLSELIANNYTVTVSPRIPPSLASGKQLYTEQCASCHGVNGDGNGPQAARLSPPPINFQDMQRQQERSIWGLYSAITQGVEGTAMPEFRSLTEGQRWALAFYVSNFPFSNEQREAGEALWANTPVQGWIPDITALSAITAAEAEQRFGEQGPEVLAYLRSEPQVLASAQGALHTARKLLGASIEQYRSGHEQLAYQLALSAYLDGFELGEAALASSDPEMTKGLERAMLRFREQIRAQTPLAEVERHYGELLAALGEASAALAENSMSPSMGFVSAYVILLREGLEAILLLAAIAAVLIKLDRRDTLPYLHAGWIGALVLGGVTWAVSNYLFTISGAGRELTEGLTALLACGVLLYVGFWLHDKTHAVRWREFVDGTVRNALQGKTLWMLTFIAFLAVYREVFETVLFYQALWLQAAPDTHSSLWGGILGALFSLVALGWLILRSSIRLPLNLVFRLNAAILFILAVVFAGHGVAGLQEAGWLPVDLIAFPNIDLLGIYPTLETLAAQLVVMVLVSLIFLRQRRLPDANC